ncbi:actin-binding LIM protein 2-like isoform X2 [Leucoraja erinacea]|uniref:actin-binding LIM protein 2-like isoform X2 n=1 Tax=Leucoraja erinaceus TaxID=7782 RepID=UPI002458D059|nr:actin-binding LIM protein 2-like isoform X2 [Leucoraja erinacea]
MSTSVSQHMAMHSPLGRPAGVGVLCQKCGKPCKGEALRVQRQFFHINCFTCKECGCDLAEGGFFVRQGEYICTSDYQKLYGTRCFSCSEFIEGEVVSALGKTYHPNCFVCAVCRQPFPPGDRVTFNGKECICQKCSQFPATNSKHVPAQAPINCEGCGLEIKNGQSLVALDKQWHLGCFKCLTCGKALSAEYICKDGNPYCEADYHSQFGIKCERCTKFITGRVLEAGEKHYHPDCARCVRCEEMFAEGEEMYLQGTLIWHPVCKQAARAEEKQKVTRTSSESITSVPASSTSGSPSRIIFAKLDDEILDYRDLAALPKVKAIYNIDRPDMISYAPYINYSSIDRHRMGEPPRLHYSTQPEDEQEGPRQRRASSPGSFASLGYGRYTPTWSRSPQHFHRPETEGKADNIYRKPPVYRQHVGEWQSRGFWIEDSDEGGGPVYWDQDDKKVKPSSLKGQVEIADNSQDLDPKSSSRSPAADREPLQRSNSESLFQTSKCVFSEILDFLPHSNDLHVCRLIGMINVKIVPSVCRIVLICVDRWSARTRWAEGSVSVLYL